MNKLNLSAEQAEYYVGQVVASFSFEGMDIPVKEQEILKKIAMGEISMEDYIKKLKEN